MAASLYDFNIEKGTSFTLSIVYKNQNNVPIDLTGYCARLVWRTNTGDVSTFLSTIIDLPKYYFNVDGPTGRITFKLPATETNNYEFRTAKYDLEIQSDDDHYTGGGKLTTRILYGTITIIPRNSQEPSVLACAT
jgi:hypothetical protein